jgi:hypothetical protein
MIVYTRTQNQDVTQSLKWLELLKVDHKKIRESRLKEDQTSPGDGNNKCNPGTISVLSAVSVFPVTKILKNELKSRKNTFFSSVIKSKLETQKPRIDNRSRVEKTQGNIGFPVSMLRSRTSSISRGNMVLFPPYHLG